MLEKFDEHFRKRLSDYEEEPDEGLWRIVAPPPGATHRSQRLMRVNRAASYLSIIPIALLLFNAFEISSVIKIKQVVMPLNSNLSADLQEQFSVDSSLQNEERKHLNLKELITKNNYGKKSTSEHKNYTNKNEEGYKHKPIESKNELHTNLLAVVVTPAYTNDEPLIAKEFLKQYTKELKTDSVLFKESEKKIISSEKTDSDKEKKKLFKKKTLYFMAMPTFGYQRIETNKNDNIFIEGINRVANFSIKRLGVRMEVGIQVPVSDRVQVSAGLLYFQRKQTIGYSEKMIDSMLVTSSTNAEMVLTPQFSYEQKVFEYELKNVGLQAGINYILTTGKFLHTAGTGLEVHKGLRKPSAKEEQLLGKDPSVYLFYNLFYRLQYPAVGKLKAIFQPTLNYSLYLNEDINAPFYVKPYGLGLNLGLTYNF